MLAIFREFNKKIPLLFLVPALLIIIHGKTIHSQTAEISAYKGDPKTIAHDFLDLEKDFGAGKDDYSIINKLINRAVNKITPLKSYTTEDAVKTMSAIDALLRDEGFTFKNNLLLCKGLRKKTIDCDNYCALYIAISEVLKIPIIPAYAPNHSFLRFCFDDGTYLNWEPTQAVPRQDSYYIKTLAIPDKSIQKGVYMKNLTRGEFIAVEYNNIGAHLMGLRKYAEALPCFSSAIKLYPLFSSAYHNRGSAYYAMKRLSEALEDLSKANDLDPSRASTHNTLGDIYFDRKEYEAALREYSTSIRLDPTNYVPYNSIALIMKIKGNEKESLKWLKKSKEIRARYEK